MLERNDLAVHLGAHALVADVGMDAIGKIDGCRALGQFLHVAPGSENIDHVREQVALDRLHEFLGVRQVALPLQQLPEPGELLFLALADRRFFLVPPVRGNAFLGEPVHLLGPDLEFHPLSLGADDRGMERLVEVRLRNADEILEPAGHRGPERMDQTQDGVAVDLAVGNDPDRDQVVNILERDPLLQHLLINAVEMLRPPLYLALVPVFGQLPLS